MNVIQLFEPHPNTLYTIDTTAQLADVPRHAILVYFKHGLVAPLVDAEGVYYFNNDAIRVLRQVEYLRVACGLNLPGIKMAIDLIHEVEQLRAEVRFLRR